MSTELYLLWKEVLAVESNIPFLYKWVLIFSIPACVISAVLLNSIYPMFGARFFGALWTYHCYKLDVLGDEQLRFVWNNINPGFLMGAGLALLLNAAYPPVALLAVLLGMIPHTLTSMVYADYMRPVVQARILARLENDPKMRALFMRLYERREQNELE